jgi:predicted ATPase
VLAAAQVCRRLDGIPLAIELAAAWVKTLRVEQIAARLDDRFHLLTGGSRTALPRQQTLRALIDWSYNLLTEPERTLLRRLSVFAGGWTLEAAEAVGGAEAEVLELLAQLVNKSLVVVERPLGAEARYTLLETIRQYALEKLAESGEGEFTRRQHLAYFLRLAQRAEPHFYDAGQTEWLQKIEAEHENIRAALEWSLQSEVANGQQLALALWWAWNISGRTSEGYDWLGRMLPPPPMPKRRPRPSSFRVGDGWHSRWATMS